MQVKTADLKYMVTPDLSVQHTHGPEIQAKGAEVGPSSRRKRKAENAPESEKPSKFRNVEPREEFFEETLDSSRRGKKRKRESDRGLEFAQDDAVSEFVFCKKHRGRFNEGCPTSAAKLRAKVFFPAEDHGNGFEASNGPKMHPPDYEAMRKSPKMLKRRDVKKIALLGQGVFGRVHRCLIRTSGDQWQDAVLKVAITMDGRRLFSNEVKILQALQGIWGVPLLYGKTKYPKYGLVMSFSGSLTLWPFLKKHFNDTEKLFSVLSKVAQILDDIHSTGIGHNDLHLNNIVINEDLLTENGHECPTIIDFGYALPFGSRLFLKPMPNWEHRHYHPELARDCGLTKPEHDVYSLAKLVMLVPGVWEAFSRAKLSLLSLLRRALDLVPGGCPSLGEFSEALRLAAAAEKRFHLLKKEELKRVPKSS